MPTPSVGRPPSPPGPVLEALRAHLAADYRRQITAAVREQHDEGSCPEMKETGRRLLSQMQPR
ncbi:hypothetical protein ACFQU9_21025 [Actinomadura namibiensis]|uniref:Uncharacterized protein n=1 Tax=Actinomadura namibiensis TaxID=182080 RepID=A0A7W3LQP5_ACTNM|nr:hypothetical protein [Actinomadura namibiensis]MBA8952596.1 hypothetical protein [Actinomadura namibiensis]